MPDLTGKTALVTGANSGIGKQAAMALAGAGATVLLGCRDPKKAAVATSDILDEHPDADVQPLPLDLADLDMIAVAAEHVLGRRRPLDLLINNAGVMAPPRMETEQGFELQLGTNHLGHFALTGLADAKAARGGRGADRQRLQHRPPAGHRWTSTTSTGSRATHAGPPTGARSSPTCSSPSSSIAACARPTRSAIALACHPGYAATGLQTSGPGEGIWGIVLKPLGMIGNLILAQSDEAGARPTLYAATSPDVEGSDFIGPDGIGQARGNPTQVGCSSEARNTEDARRLWDVSVELTGVDYAALG